MRTASRNCGARRTRPSPHEEFEKASGLKRQIAEVEGELAGIEERREGVVSVTASDIADIVSRRTGIPVSQLTAA